MSATSNSDTSAPPVGRSFRLMDGLLILFLVGMAFAVDRHLLQDWREYGRSVNLPEPLTLDKDAGPVESWLTSTEIDSYFSNYGDAPNYIAVLFYTAVLLSPMLWLGSLGLAAMHILPPQRSFRGAPGAVAAFTVSSVVCALLLLWCVFLLLDLARVPIGFDPWLLHHDKFQGPYFRVLPLPGLAVIGAWIYLANSRKWAPERSGIDRIGRFLSWAWIVCTPLFLLILLAVR